MFSEIKPHQAAVSSEAICLQLIRTPAGDFQLTDRKLRGMLIDAIANADPSEHFDPEFDCESTIELEPKPLSEIIAIMQSKGALENFSEESLTPDHAEEQIFDWIEDHLIDLCNQTPIFPDWVEKIR